MLNHPGVKLVCLLVAVVLWVQVASTVEVEELVDLPVELVDLPDSLVVRSRSVPERVGVRIRGSRLQLLLEDALHQEFGKVELNLANASPGAYRYELSVLDVVVNATPVEIVPATTVDVGIHLRAERQLPVRIAVEGQLPEGYTLAGRPEIIPAQVSVSGPEFLVEGLDHVNTVPVRLGRRKGSFQERVALAAPDPDLRLHPLEVEVAVGVDQIVERSFVNLPISILSDMDPARIHVEPTTAQVRVQGAAGRVQALGLEDVSLVLHIGDLAGGVYQLDAEVVLPEGVGAMSVEPSSFQVIVEGDGAGAGSGP